MKIKASDLESRMNQIQTEQEQRKIAKLSEGLDDLYNSIPKDVEKIKLFLDADDVIMDSSLAVIGKYNREFRSNPLHRIAEKEDVWDWGYRSVCPLAPLEWVTDFFTTEEDVMSIRAMPYSKYTLKRLTKAFDIVVVTIGLQGNICAKTKWFNENFPFLSDIIYLYNDKCHMDKSVINMQGGIFVDDHLNNLKSSNADVKIAFGDEREYNKGAKLRIRTFPELEGYLVKLACDYYDRKEN